MTQSLPDAPTASPPVADSPVDTAPAPLRPATPSRLFRGRGLWDWLAATLLVVLTLLVASAPARNSEIWMHLATGRALWTGAAGPRVDPFAYTTTDVPWTNPYWLTDLAAYGVYAALGSAGLAVGKAILLTLLAVALVATCWRGPVRWLAVFAVGVSLVALGPFVELRPICVSYFLLGCTLWWVVRADRRAVDTPPGSATTAFLGYLPLLLMFAIWANLDRWCVLGPAVLLLWWLGTLLQIEINRARKAASVVCPAQVGGLSLAALLSLLTPLVSPHHVRSLSLLPALFSGSSGAGGHPSPFEGELQVPGLGLPPAALAYFALIGLGLIAFVYNRANLSWPAVFVWTALLAFSLYDKATVPFFSVVAGAIAGLQFQAGGALRFASTSTPPTHRTGLAQFATMLLLAAGLAVAWPGWLQGSTAEPRAWQIVQDPSLTEAGAQLAHWHDSGLKLGRGFQFSAASADALAWLCPQEKGFLDNRAGLFPAQVRAEDNAIKQGLLGSGDADWRSLLQARDITHVLVYDTADRRLTTVLRRMFAATQEWRPIYLRGRTVIFAWAQAEKAGRAGDLPKLPTIDLSARAFHPEDAQPLPLTRPQFPQSRTWADAFLRPGTVPNLGRGEAVVYLAHFEAQRPAYLQANQRLWENALAASAVVAGATVGEPPGALELGCGLRCAVLEASHRPVGGEKKAAPGPLDLFTGQLIGGWLAQRDHGPAASALLAIRAARRAVQEDPDDAMAYLSLGQAYLRLMRDTTESKALGAALTIARLREAQVAAALKQAVRLQPGLLAGHEALTNFHEQTGHLDLALQHLRAQLSILRTIVPTAENAAALRQHLERQEETERNLGDHVNDQTLLVESRTFQRDVVKQALFAQDKGLPGVALDLLRKSDSATRGRAGELLKLQLALVAGEALELRQEFEPSAEDAQADAPEPLDYRWVRAQLAAAEGAYRDADAELTALTIAEGIDIPDLRVRKAPLGTVVAILVGQSVLDQAVPQPRVIQFSTLRLSVDVDPLVAEYRGQADIACLRGLLALESGDLQSARDAFRGSLARWQGATDGAPLLARHYLALLGHDGKRGGP